MVMEASPCLIAFEPRFAKQPSLAPTIKGVVISTPIRSAYLALTPIMGKVTGTGTDKRPIVIPASSKAGRCHLKVCILNKPVAEAME